MLSRGYGSRRRVSVFVAASLTGALASLCHAQTTPAWFDQAFAEQQLGVLRELSGVPSLSATIMRLNDPEPATAALGVRRVSDLAPVTSADRYHVGSNAKAITSSILAEYVQRGVLSWESTIGDVLSSRIPEIDARYRDVTLREILTMRGGLPMLFTNDELLAYAGLPGTPHEQREQIAALILAQPPAFDRSESHYSNAAYMIAGLMGEIASGKTWEAEVTRLLETSLGLHIEIGWPGSDGSDQPWGHVLSEGQMLEIDPRGEIQFPVAFNPAGNLSMSIPNLAEFGRQHLRALRGVTSALPFDSQRVEQMHDTQGRVFAMGWTDLRPIGGIGDGWIGSTDAFTSQLFIDRSRGLAVAVAVNGNGALDDGSIALFIAADIMLHAVHACPADFNNDDAVDFGDFDDFVAAFERGEIGADFNDDGFLDFSDFDDFVAAFETSCAG
ncbi:MAG: serine hydrolase [Planctomycetota bacterium]|nr:serine hydrolase [Planctomycetota bacterium]